MPRVLTKGSRAGVEDNHSDWDEQENLKNNNIAFYDLRGLENRRQDYAHPWFDFDNAVSLPSRDDVTQFLFGGNDLVVRLPEHKEIKLPGENRDGEEKWYDCDLFSWLPFYVILNDEDGGDLIQIKDGCEKWSECFNDGFEWNVVIQRVEKRSMYRSTPYSDPRPRPTKPGESQQLRQQPETLSSPQPSDYGPLVEEEVIAVDNVDRSIASKITLSAEGEDGEMIESEGSAYLIPPHPSKQFDEFVQDILQDVFDIDVESVPDWVSDYPIIGEEQLREEVEQLEDQLSKLESKVEKGKWYRQLLFANDDNDTDYELEEPVRKAFREAGLTVDGEKPGFRDGGIQLDDQTIILEITGRSRGVSIGKIQKLERHVEDAAEEGYGEDPTGILVYNPFRNEDPISRSLNPQNFVDELEKRDFKLIMTYQVYKMLSQYKQGEIDTDTIVDKLTGDETIIEFSESVEKDGPELQSRIEALRNRLTKLFRQPGN